MSINSIRCFDAQNASTRRRCKIEGDPSRDSTPDGPGKQFAKFSAAVRTAKGGEIIEIDARGDYSGDVCQIRANDLTIRGIGDERAKFPSAGKNANGKGIWVVSGNNITIENIEFSGARVRDRNGAGIRAQGTNLTVRNCKFHDCEMGILGGAGNMLIEYSEFSHCGLDDLAHNLYINERVDKLIFRFNYSHHAHIGHLFKSRAKENYILYNYLSDEEDGTSSYVLNLPNGGMSFLIGNIICQGSRARNRTMIAYEFNGRQKRKR